MSRLPSRLNKRLERRASHSSDKSLCNKLLNRLSRMIIVIPNTADSVRVLTSRVCGAVRRRVVDHRQESRRRVEDLSRNAAMRGLEAGQIRRKGRVVRRYVIDEAGEVRVGVACEHGRLVECYWRTGQPCRMGTTRSPAWESHTRHCQQHELANSIVVQIIQETEVYCHDVVDWACRVERGLPEAFAHVVDSHPDGHECVCRSPWSLGWRWHEVLFELADLRYEVGRHTGVDDRVGGVCAIVCPVVSQDEA